MVETDMTGMAVNGKNSRAFIESVWKSAVY